MTGKSIVITVTRLLATFIFLSVTIGCNSSIGSTDNNQSTNPAVLTPTSIINPTKTDIVESNNTLQPADKSVATMITPSPSSLSTPSPKTFDEVRWDIYHPDPQHLWNRLFQQLYRRTAQDAKEYGGDSLDPLLWPETTHLLEESTHEPAIQLLDVFLSTQGEELIADPLKRAMFQRDMWAVFDWLANKPLKATASPCGF